MISRTEVTLLVAAQILTAVALIVHILGGSCS